MSPTPPFFLQAAGRSQFRNQRSGPIAKGGLHTLRLFLDGEFHYRKAGNRQVIQGRSFGLFHRRTIGVLVGASEVPARYLYARFGGDCAERYVERVLQGSEERLWVPDCMDELQELMLSLTQRQSLRSPETHTELDDLDLLLGRILIRLPQVSVGNPGRRPNFGPVQLRNYLLDRLHQATSLAAIAAHFGVSRATIIRRTRHELGTTVHKIHETMKIEWAKELLQLGHLSVQEVARQVGYEDAFYFSRVFRKSTGQSPRHWTARQIRDHIAQVERTAPPR
jgi:AraC-like DNA-binding protein